MFIRIWSTIVLLLLTSCVKSNYGLYTAGTYANDPPQLRTMASKSHLDIDIAFSGIASYTHNGVEHSALEFAWKLENTGHKDIVLQPAKYMLLDDEGQKLSLSSKAITTITLEPKTTTEFTLTFALPSQYELERIGSFRLQWHYQRNAQLYRRTTKFIRRKIEYRYRTVYPIDYPYGYCYSPWHSHHYRHRYQW